MKLIPLPQLTEAMIAKWKASPGYTKPRVRPESSFVWHITRPDGEHAWFTDNPIEAAYFSPPWHCEHKVVQWGPSQPLSVGQESTQADKEGFSFASELKLMATMRPKGPDAAMCLVLANAVAALPLAQVQAPCVVCASDQPHSGTCSGPHDPRALCAKVGPAEGCRVENPYDAIALEMIATLEERDALRVQVRELQTKLDALVQEKNLVEVGSVFFRRDRQAPDVEWHANVDIQSGAVVYSRPAVTADSLITNAGDAS